MKYVKLSALIALAAALLCAAVIAPAQIARSQDPELERVKPIIKHGEQEVRDYRKAGRKVGASLK